MSLTSAAEACQFKDTKGVKGAPKGVKGAKGVITIEDDETVKMMNKVGDEGSAIENVLGDDEPENVVVTLTMSSKMQKVESCEGVLQSWQANFGFFI